MKARAKMRLDDEATRLLRLCQETVLQVFRKELGREEQKKKKKKKNQPTNTRGGHRQGKVDRGSLGIREARQ